MKEKIEVFQNNTNQVSILELHKRKKKEERRKKKEERRNRTIKSNTEIKIQIHIFDEGSFSFKKINPFAS